MLATKNVHNTEDLVKFSNKIILITRPVLQVPPQLQSQFRSAAPTPAPCWMKEGSCAGERIPMVSWALATKSIRPVQLSWTSAKVHVFPDFLGPFNLSSSLCLATPNRLGENVWLTLSPRDKQLRKEYCCWNGSHLCSSEGRKCYVLGPE